MKQESPKMFTSQSKNISTLLSFHACCSLNVHLSPYLCLFLLNGYAGNIGVCYTPQNPFIVGRSC